jgi:purine-binding chemotaxis protein CheW
MSGEEDSHRFLLCRIGLRIGAVALQNVRETMRPLPVEPLAGAPPFVLGVAIVRGAPTPVVDANRLLGASSTSSTPILSPSPARFVSLKLDRRTVALAVDAVLDIRSLPAGMLAGIPPLLQGADTALLSLIGALDTKLLIVLEAARLVPDSVWTVINTARATA